MGNVRFDRRQAKYIFDTDAGLAEIVVIWDVCTESDLAETPSDHGSSPESGRLTPLADAHTLRGRAVEQQVGTPAKKRFLRIGPLRLLPFRGFPWKAP